MKKALKFEFEKMLRSPFFYISLGCMLLFVLMSGVDSIIGYNVTVNEVYPHYMESGKFVRNDFQALNTSYQNWIGSELLTLASTLFFTLLPVFCVLPFAASLYTEKKSGYIKNVVHYTGKRNYFLSKILVVFTSGFLVVFVPLIINFLVVSAFIPSTVPHVNYNFYTYVNFGDMWSDIFFSNPILYVALYILLDSVFGGILALSAVAVSFYIHNKVAIILIPFLSILGIDYLSKIYIGNTLGSAPLNFSPLSFLRGAHMGGVVAWWIVAGELLVITLFSVITVMARGLHDEIY